MILCLDEAMSLQGLPDNMGVGLHHLEGQVAVLCLRRVKVRIRVAQFRFLDHFYRLESDRFIEF